MASLKALKIRIGSVKATQKITKAITMVAAAKLRRASEAAVAGRPYAGSPDRVTASLAAPLTVSASSPNLLASHAQDAWTVTCVWAAGPGPTTYREKGAQSG